MEMDIEEPPAPNNSNSFKRLSMKNSIQTSFGDDYVFQIVSSQGNSSLAVSLSTNTVKLYSPGTGQYLGECKGHSNTIHQISFSGPSTPHLFHSCSSDRTIRSWDTRTFKQVCSLRAGSSQEIFSFSFGGSNDNLLACGCQSQCMGLEKWKNEANFEDARSSASKSWILNHVDYFVDCQYSEANDRLWVIGGTNTGTLGYFPINYKGMGEIGPPEATLEGGHTGCEDCAIFVKPAWWASSYTRHFWMDGG
uniref:Uncharacterized protein n=1 Tax=Nelumbo nucifera TaxID=4432 RepID=A0A822YZX1_NELNU|nr:TPA_asm: hypothetical protein HUJ06_008708 [Nelumbo nucifera]